MNSNKLAVIFPGMGYHSDKPLLYYAKKLAREHGYEIVDIKYDFQVKAREIMDDKEAKDEVFYHAVREAEEQLETVDFASYDRILFIGKSIGTTVAAYIDNEHGINATHIVFTPVPETFGYLREESGLVLHGTSDPWCDTKLAEEKCTELKLQLEKVEGANHSLEEGDAFVDVAQLPVIIGAVKMYVENLS